LTFPPLENGNPVNGIKIRGYCGDSNCIAGAGDSIRKSELQKWEKVGLGVHSEEGYLEKDNAKL